MAAAHAAPAEVPQRPRVRLRVKTPAPPLLFQPPARITQPLSDPTDDDAWIDRAVEAMQDLEQIEASHQFEQHEAELEAADMQAFEDWMSGAEPFAAHLPSARPSAELLCGAEPLAAHTCRRAWSPCSVRAIPW